MSRVTLYERIAELPVQIESHTLEPLAFTTPHFTRLTTTVALSGGGHTGRGEDVAYSDSDQEAHRTMAPLVLEGRRTFGAWSVLLDSMAVTPMEPAAPAVRDYRRWAYESALLDLGLRQAGTTLGKLIGRPPEPVRFCLSSGLGPEPWLVEYPELEFKLDIRDDWDEARVEALAALDRVRVVDFKTHYEEDFGQAEGDSALLERVARLLPDVIIEDPATDAATWALIGSEAQRVAFDSPIHSVADILALPSTGCMNIKPSRFGTLERLLLAIEHCETRGMQIYGGGQFELGTGRRQIQELAALFYPDGPNDVAPGGFNAPQVVAGLPASPLVGFGRQPGFGASGIS